MSASMPNPARSATVASAIIPGLATVSSETSKQCITFKIDAQEYAVDIMVVREIKGWTETTALPQSPPYVRGVINLRGIIVPILDLRARFGMGPTTPTRLHVVIIAIVGSRIAGLLVDAVSDIISLQPEMVRPVRTWGWWAVKASWRVW